MSSVDNTNKFTGKAQVYSAARPHYAAELFEMLAKEYGFKGVPIADVGSGTGIFADGLLSHGNTVYGIEPNGGMHAAAEGSLSAYQKFISVVGTAEHTSLPQKSVYAVTAAQAFHWFDADKFRAECNRIMYGEYVVIAYNSRTYVALHRAVEEVNRAVCPNFKGFEGGVTEDKISDFFGGSYKKYVFPNNLVMDYKTFIGRCLSSSYAPREGDENYDCYISAMLGVFEKYVRGSRLEFPLESKAYIGKIR